MHTLTHRPLRLVLLMPTHAPSVVLPLGAAVYGLPGLEVDGVGVHNVRGHGDDIRDKAVQ